MVSVADVNKLNAYDKAAIAKEETRIDQELMIRGAASTASITIDAPKDLNMKSCAALKEKYRAGGWYIKEVSDYQGSYWKFYITPPAEDFLQ